MIARGASAARPARGVIGPTMKGKRMRWWRAVAAALILAAGLALGPASAPTVRAAGQWTPGASLGWARQFHAAALADGAVLVSGGAGRPAAGGPFADALATTERYDPPTGRWTPTAPLALPRAFHTATTLRDGTVLVVGGRGLAADDTARSAERYDLVADHWTPVAPPHEGRIEHTATLLPDGTILVVGGVGYTGAGTTTAERYDPVADRWTPTAPPARERRKGQTATLLPSGAVLVTGGIPAPPPECDSGDACTAGALADAEIYDPATDRWATTPARAAATQHFNHTATLLDDGTVLVVGGFVAGKPEGQTVERFDPVAGRWTVAAPLTIGRVYHTAIPLPGGRLLVAGGYGPIASTEIFGDDGAPAVACFTLTRQCVRGRFLQYWRAHGGLATNGYPISDERFETLEDDREYLVQYFERVRLEYHPENAPPHDVLLGQFGRRILGGAHPPAPPLPGRRHFPQTGHNLGGPFLTYWETNGGLAQFGLPLTEERPERLEDGKTYTVQYFERARFEHHPQNAPPYDVLLGQFGRQILAENEQRAGP